MVSNSKIAMPSDPFANTHPGSELFLTLAPGMVMIFMRIPAGAFMMGSADEESGAEYNEKPLHSVYLSEFYIGRYPVTVSQFARFVQDTGHISTAEQIGSGSVFNGVSWQEVSGAWWKHPRGPGSGVEEKSHHPVTQVSYYDAVAFCRWANPADPRHTLRLPTEAEWEKTARGCDRRRFPWGDQLPDETLCNFNNNVGDTTAVGSYIPQGDSLFGCSDMAGNVWEWTDSAYQPYPYRRDIGYIEGEGDEFRVLRGGAFSLGQKYQRSAFREWVNPESRSNDLGFRVIVIRVSGDEKR